MMLATIAAKSTSLRVCVMHTILQPVNQKVSIQKSYICRRLQGSWELFTIKLALLQYSPQRKLTDF